ncbi:hypothetical protein [Leifsonia poae]|uniref:hypothetical protein n=1 Tax=Leifsonia poae TaxID=110933 RepID=UPI0022F287EC|nr:hypothetical protein [Leifsonia poae]
MPVSIAVSDALGATAPSGILERDESRRINEASRLVQLHHAVATDHLAAFAGLLNLPGSHGPSVAAVERSLLETWGRIWWILGAHTALAAEYRARAMIVAELEAGDRRGIQMLSAESISDAIARASRARDEIPPIEPSESVPGPTSLVTNFLQQSGVAPRDFRAVYSHLSGVSHGESVFTESLTELPGLAAVRTPVIVLPSDNLGKYSATVWGATLIGTSRLMGTWGLDSGIRDAFIQKATEVGAQLDSGDPPTTRSSTSNSARRRTKRR